MNNDERSEESVAAAATQRLQQAINAVPKDLVQAEDQILDRVSRAKGGPFAQLRLIYDLMDRLSAAVIRSTPCKTRCSSCCHYPVQASELEARLIERETRHRVRLKRTPDGQWNGLACPFLKEHRCSIYEHRPFVCRRHFAFTADSYWCHPDRANKIQLPMLRLTGAESARRTLSMESGMDQTADIREWFGLVLR